MVRTPDAGARRLYYGKSYIYPLFAAPFVWLFGTNGFLVFHALLLTLSFARRVPISGGPGIEPVLAAGFAAVFHLRLGAPVYFVWLTPEFFNFTLVSLRVLPLELQGRRAAGGVSWPARTVSSSPTLGLCRAVCSASRRSPSRRTSC